MTLDEIKAAVRAGKTVHWANKGYVVVRHVRKSGEEAWSLVFEPNGHGIGLTHADGVTMNGEQEKFFIAPESERGLT
jgi:hypothetical protein